MPLKNGDGTLWITMIWQKPKRENNKITSTGTMIMVQPEL